MNCVCGFFIRIFKYHFNINISVLSTSATGCFLTKEAARVRAATTDYNIMKMALNTNIFVYDKCMQHVGSNFKLSLHSCKIDWNFTSCDRNCLSISLFFFFASLETSEEKKHKRPKLNRKCEPEWKDKVNKKKTNLKDNAVLLLLPFHH